MRRMEYISPSLGLRFIRMLYFSQQNGAGEGGPIRRLHLKSLHVFPLTIFATTVGMRLDH